MSLAPLKTRMIVYQSLSLGTSGSQWLPVVTSGYQWLPVVLSGY